jgi:hypothetical protein
MGRGIGTVASIFLLLTVAGAIGLGNATPAAAEEGIPTITVSALSRGLRLQSLQPSITARIQFGKPN